MAMTSRDVEMRFLAGLQRQRRRRVQMASRPNTNRVGGACDSSLMWSRNPWVVGVVSSLIATAVTSAASAIFHAHFSTGFVLGILAVAVIVGLATFSALLLRQKGEIDRELDRLEVALWPGWIREIGLAARQTGFKVFGVSGSVVFENAAGEQHLLAAKPSGGEVGQVLAREQALAVLEVWGLRVSHNRRGQRIVAF
jgi:hypothetical protein